MKAKLMKVGDQYYIKKLVNYKSIHFKYQYLSKGHYSYSEWYLDSDSNEKQLFDSIEEAEEAWHWYKDREYNNKVWKKQQDKKEKKVLIKKLK